MRNLVLRNARLARALTQKELALLAGIDKPNRIGQFEIGRLRPRPEEASSIAKVLYRTPREIFGDNIQEARREQA